MGLFGKLFGKTASATAYEIYKDDQLSLSYDTKHPMSEPSRKGTVKTSAPSSTIANEYLVALLGALQGFDGPRSQLTVALSMANMTLLYAKNDKDEDIAMVKDAIQQLEAMLKQSLPSADEMLNTMPRREL